MITIPALLLAGGGTSRPGSATALRSIVGTDLIGARGATPADQRKIDQTVVGICAAKGECARHTGKGAECRRNIRL
ncbi:hypothetical protein CN180_22165 [Sinorhizobium medicae]|nr:hypothetical protein CN180_22165 [Sinorhizobium medicae]